MSQAAALARIFGECREGQIPRPLQSFEDPLNKQIGFEYAASAVFCTLQAGALFVFIWKNSLTERYGLCKASVPASRFLY